MNTPVNFEIAKLLKEKGFDTIDCSGYYHICDGYTKGYSHCYSDVNTQKEDAILAPTVADAVMWLYEEHGIWIECLHRGDMGDFTFKVSKLENGWRTEPHYIHERGFNSPTEAYEAAIEYTLTNIK